MEEDEKDPLVVGTQRMDVALIFFKNQNKYTWCSVDEMLEYLHTWYHETWYNSDKDTKNLNHTYSLSMIELPFMTQNNRPRFVAPHSAALVGV